MPSLIAYAGEALADCGGDRDFAIAHIYRRLRREGFARTRRGRQVPEMAYSDWGAFVHCNGVRRIDREDVAVFGDDGTDEDGTAIPSGGRIFVNLLAQQERHPEGGAPWWQQAHHAVLGDGPLRLTGYKCRPELWRAAADGAVTAVDHKPHDLIEGDPGEYGYGDCHYRGTIDGHVFQARMFNGNMVDLELVTPDGVVWRARCGYLYGAGHMDYVANRDREPSAWMAGQLT